MAKIEVFLLQTPYVLLDNVQITFPFKKAEALFYYILSERTVTRDYISTLLWEDANADTARKNLRNALYMLKKTFGFEVVSSSSGFNLILHPDVSISCDLFAFLEGDMSVYQDNFLCNFTVKKTTLFEDWMVRKREYLKNQYLVRLCDHIQTIPTSNLLDIELNCSNYMKQDPFDERIVYTLIKAYGDNHLYLKGIQAYQKLRKELEEELGIIPGQEVTQLYKLLRTEWAETTTDEESEEKQVITARSKEEQLLKQTYHEFLNGQTSSILIDGENGVGKSTLVQSLTDTIDHDSVLFLESYCYQDEMNTLLYPWNSILMQLDEYIDRHNIQLSSSCIEIISQFFPTFGGSSAPADSLPFDLANVYNLRAIQNSILRILYRITEQTPVFLMIDNLHYADWASLQIFTSLLRELRHNFMLVSTALNSSVDSLSEFILHIPKRVGLKQIHLTRFSIEDMQEIISSKTDINKIPADILTSIYETTAGNAFFLNELLNNYKEQGSLDTFSDQAQNILSQRLQGLSTQSRQLLDIISLLHNYASLNLLEHVNGRSTLDILESVEELTARALIIEKQRHGKTIFTFTHGKMREYVVGLIPPSKCRILYKSIACALEEILPPKNNATYNRLIQYFELAGMQTKVLKYQIYLLEELSIAQYELYPSQVTFEQSPAPADQSAFFSNIEEQLKKERHNFTQDEEYEELSARLLIAKGRYYILSGLYNEGLICIRRCFHLGYVRRHSSYLLRAYRQMIYYGIQLYEPELMKQYLDLGLALASEQNYLMERALFLRLNGLYHLMCNEYEESEEDLRTSISIFEHHTLQNSTTLLNISAAYNYLGELQRKKQQPDKAIAFYHKAIHLCQEHSLAINPTHYTNLGSAYRAVGKNDKAFASYATACSLYDNSYTLMGRSVAKSRYAVFLCERGDFSMADKFLHEANAACNKLGSPVEKGLLRKTQAELLIQYPKECKGFLPEPLEFYLSDAKRLMNIDHQLPEWKELAEL